MIGKEDCTHSTLRVEPFMSVSVEVKGKSNLNEALMQLV